VIDAYLGVEMGILNEQFMRDMQKQLAPDEYLRQLLCKNIAARDFIWTSWIRSAVQTGVKAGIEFAQPLPGEVYKKRGLISFGYDHSGHGEDPAASRSALIVWEQLGSWLVPICARTWHPGTDDRAVKNDLISYWRYFRPDAAMGDAFGVGMLTELNDDLFIQGLTTIDRRAVADGDSTATAWADWPFAPLRFEGMVKHQMASALRALFSSHRVALPYCDDVETDDPERGDMRWFQRQLSNISATATSKTYASYKMIKRTLGDDLFDAAMAGVWALITRGAASPGSVVITSGRRRDDMIGNERLLPSDPVEVS